MARVEEALALLSRRHGTTRTTSASLSKGVVDYEYMRGLGGWHEEKLFLGDEDELSIYISA